jgi:Exostosin family
MTWLLDRSIFGIALSTAFILSILLNVYSFTGPNSFFCVLSSSSKLQDARMKKESAKDSSDKREITFTNYGWFHPDPKKGIKTPRCLAMKYFSDAILSHERYNSTTWKDLEKHPNENRSIIAFLDIDTCRDVHWPKFGGDFTTNSDLERGRVPMTGWDFLSDCPIIEQALQSPALSSRNSRLVVLSCATNNLYSIPCLRRDRKDYGSFSKLIVGHLSAHKNDVHPRDFGLPPWPVKTVSLTSRQIQDIHTCQNRSRTLLFSFKGRGRIPFPEFSDYFEPLHQKQNVYASFSFDHYFTSQQKNAWDGYILENTPPENQTKEDYYRLLTLSDFAGAPRGDCLYSVRFSEILSSGAIPVLYSDGWVLPYNRDVVDWNELAVVLPQHRVNETLRVLQDMPDDIRCKMRQKGLQFFQTYLSTSAGRLRAILEILAASHENNGVATFSAAPE